MSEGNLGVEGAPGGRAQYLDLSQRKKREKDGRRKEAYGQAEMTNRRSKHGRGRKRGRQKKKHKKMHKPGGGKKTRKEECPPKRTQHREPNGAEPVNETQEAKDAEGSCTTKV